MNTLNNGTTVRLLGARYKSGGPVIGRIWEHIRGDYYVMEIIGPHVAYCVEGIGNMAVSKIVIHKDNVEIYNE